MSDQSIYYYLRPVMVICFLLGNFPALNVLSDCSSDVRIKYISIPALAFYLEHVASIYIGALSFIPQTDVQEFVISIYLYFITYVSISFCNILIAKRIVFALQAIDKLRQTITSLPNSIRPRIKQPMKTALFFSLTFILTIVLELMTFETFGSYGNKLETIHFVITVITTSRQLLVLSFIFYSFSTVIEDTITAWHHYCWANCRPFSLLENFNQLLLVQCSIVQEVKHCFQIYVLLVFIDNMFVKFTSIAFVIFLKHQLIAKACIEAFWNVLLGILVLCVDEISFQFETLTQEVYAMAVRDMTWREYTKVRVLLNQLETQPGQLSAAGFFTVNSSLMLSCLSLGIEYLITYYQNLSYFLALAGLSDYSMMTSHPPSSNETAAIP